MNTKYFSLENQSKRIEKNKRLEEKQKYYKELMANQNFLIQPQWHLQKDKINFTYIEDEKPTYLKNSSDYSLYFINKDKLFEVLASVYKDCYVKEKIWDENTHTPNKITGVLEKWEKSCKLIPPILILDSKKDKFLIQDGKHRFAVAHFFDAIDIPIIIPNQTEIRFLELTNENYIWKIE